MAFVLSKSPRTLKNWPVSVPVAGDSGNVSLCEIGLDLVLLPQGDIDARIASAKIDGSADVDAQLLANVVTGWSGVVDDSGAPVPFGTDSLAQLIGQQNARGAIISAYFDALAGKAAAKN